MPRTPKRFTSSVEKRLWIVPVDAYEGDTTSIYITGAAESGDADMGVLYMVIQTSNRGAEWIDGGYRTVAEAKETWPEAVAPAGRALTERFLA